LSKGASFVFSSEQFKTRRLLSLPCAGFLAHLQTVAYPAR
jgi:hypothetical protein